MVVQIPRSRSAVGLNYVQWQLFFNLLHVTLLVSRILRCLLDIWRTCATLNTYIMAYLFSWQGLSLRMWTIQNSFSISECFRYQTGGGRQFPAPQEPSRTPPTHATTTYTTTDVISMPRAKFEHTTSVSRRYKIVSTLYHAANVAGFIVHY